MTSALLLLVALVPSQEKTLRDRLDDLVRGFTLKDARAGVLVYSVRANRTIYAANDRSPFKLASNTKLLTSAAALCRLGPEFKFRTTAGMAEANLHVFAGGDPNLSGRFHNDDPTAIFKSWAARFKAAGVTRVEDVVLHTEIFDHEHLNPGWTTYDPWFWWTAPFGALSLNDNCVDFRIEPGQAGAPCTVTMSPDTGYVTLVNRTRTVAQPQQPFGFTRAPGTNVITLRGEWPLLGSHVYPVAIHDPALYFGTVLKETFAREGIEVAGKIVETDVPAGRVEGFRELAVHVSDLPTTLAVCNQPSQNFYAEMLLRVLAWKLKGKGTLQGGLEAAREFFTRDAGLEEVSQEDGSGLTPQNLASPADLVKLLLYMRTHKDGEIYYRSLPASGMAKGTLRNRMLDEDVKGRVRAKTGHIGEAAALSGYAEALCGDTYVFSILVNAVPGTPMASADRLQDRICELLVRYRGD